MDLYEAEDFFKNIYPGKKLTLSFPKECHRQYEIIMTNGKPNPMHHVECHHVMIEIEGEKSFTVPIKPHRLTLPIAWFKENVPEALKGDVHAP